MPEGIKNRKKRDPFQLSNAEWQRLKRKGIDPKDIKGLIRDAWSHSDNYKSFSHALEERGLFLARGDKRGFVVMDHKENIYSLSRHGGIKTKDIKLKLGASEHAPSITMTGLKIRKTYNAEALEQVRALKDRQQEKLQPLMEKRALLVTIQRAERQELNDRQRASRHITSQSIRKGFRTGVMSFFDKVTGKESRVRTLGKKRLNTLKAKHRETRQQMVFRHNLDRIALQKQLQELKDQQKEQRLELAREIYTLRALRHAPEPETISQTFEQQSLDLKPEPEKAQEQTHKRKRSRSSEPDQTQKRARRRRIDR